MLQPCQLIYTSKSNGKSTNYYVYSVYDRNDGYIVVSADDSFPTVLGYSWQGDFENGMSNPGFKYWMDEYDRMIEYAREHNINRDNGIVTSSNYSGSIPNVRPLITTTWGQEAPFNNYCPSINGTKTPSGCVATAMAQVMYYHKWPKVGKGEREGITFEGTEYKWSDMLRSYQRDYTEINGDAVATLMRHCGAAVCMEYDIDGSGSTSTYLPHALHTFFDYDGNTRVVHRDCVEFNDYIAIICKELNESRPIIVSSNHYKGGGHGFIMDGCMDDGYFHFNWGWNGRQDGEFLILDINDKDYQSNNNMNGYINNQAIVIGIQPNTRPGIYVDFYPDLWCDGNIVMSHSKGKDLTIQTTGYFVNYGYDIHTFYLGAKFINKETRKEYFSDRSQTQLGGRRPGYSLSGTKYVVQIPDMPDGEYDVSPVFRIAEDDAWLNVLMALNAVKSKNILVADGHLSFYKANIEITDAHFSSEFVAGRTLKLQAKVKNNSDYDYDGPITLQIKQDSKIVDKTNSRIFVKAKESTNIEINYTVSLSTGDYTVELVDYDNNIHSPFNVSVTNQFKDIELNETNFPDPMFRQVLYKSFDVNKDNILSVNELLHIRGFSLTDLGYSGINSIVGINKLYALNSFDCSKQKISDINISELFNLTYFNCQSSNVKSLKISNCPNLTSLMVQYNNLVALDLTNCNNLKSVNMVGNVREIEVNDNDEFDISSLIEDGFDISKAHNWIGWDVNGNILKLTGNYAYYDYDTGKGDMSVILSKKGGVNVKISEVTFPDPVFRECMNDIFDQDKDCVLSLPEVARMRGFSLYENGYHNVKSVEGVKYIFNLGYFGCFNENIDSIDISRMTKLENFRCYNSNVRFLNASNCESLIEIDAHQNILEKLDINGTENLIKLNVQDNNLVALDLRNLKELSNYKFDNNKRTVTINENGEFNLNTLIPDGFDISKASNWKGCKVSGNILKFTSDRATYDYDTGKGIMTVTLIKGNVSSVPSIQSDDCSISVSGLTLTVDGLIGRMSVYGINGNVVYQGTASSVELPTTGIYIVNCNSKTHKIIAVN